MMPHDTTTFHTLYERHAGELHRFALWLCNDADTAKDIVAETFARVWTSDEPIRTDSVRAYLFTVARNVHLQMTRKERRMVRLQEEHHPSVHGPDRSSDAADELAAVYSELRKFPAADRTVMRMKVEEEQSYEEISQETGLTIAAIKVKIHRMRRALAARFTQH